ncbi:hypothetical protein OBBRIDRAFT_784109 [Obba rivulosa]|uniref:DUF6593 domain-containing protein n=1 Tax=Obba rivulosa TaxID=1052685 RepID=A0A8E2AM99_9APHY|nr:hypothetical protein OBBRIDRAFT_784109 [Obba rivulosa]
MASSTVLSFSPDDPCHTSITDVDGRVLYEVNTECGENSITYIQNHEDEVIASSRWRRVLPHKVTIESRAPMSVNSWLHKSIIPFVDQISFKDDDGRRYKWRGWSAKSTLELFTVEDDYKQPIARFLKPQIDYSTRPSTIVTPAQLVLDSRAVEICNTVVMSFLFLEKTRRIRERTSWSTGDSLMTVLGGFGAS